MVNNILTIQIPGPVPDTSLQATVRDNVLQETPVSVSGLGVSYAPEQEPNDSPATAQAITIPAAIEGTASPSDSGTCDLTIAPNAPDPNDCFQHTAQDYYTFTVSENKDYIIVLEFEGNQADTDLDIYLNYASNPVTGWWTWSDADNATAQVYSETLTVPLFTNDTFTLAVQAWPSWTGTANYRLTIRPAP